MSNFMSINLTTDEIDKFLKHTKLTQEKKLDVDSSLTIKEINFVV